MYLSSVDGIKSIYSLYAKYVSNMTLCHFIWYGTSWYEVTPMKIIMVVFYIIFSILRICYDVCSKINVTCVLSRGNRAI